MKYYSGIGARITPPEYINMMEDIAGLLANKGYILRTGGANGADYAFELGATKAEGSVEVWVPWEGYTKRNIEELCDGDYSQYYDFVAQHHPAWDRCSQGAKKMHGRNLKILIGSEVEENRYTLSEFVVCWTPNGQSLGGTGTGIRMAQSLGIPVYNLAKEEEVSALATLLEGM